MHAPTSRTLPIILIAVLCPAYVQAQGALDQDRGKLRAAIDSGNAAYIAAFAKADAEAVASVYADHAAHLDEHGVVLQGRDAIRAEIARFIGEVGPVTVTLETVDMWVVGNQTWESGKWSYTWTPRGGSQQTVGGRYVTVWEMQADGIWRIVADLSVPGTTSS